AGSVVETLTKDFQYQKTIVGVEKDEKVIEIGKKYFALATYANLHILHPNRAPKYSPFAR
ncbi:hypothetical protein KZZ05_21325, partial [Marinobacter adhaerens]|uniref:hypothetical protein n=1 Tax=Marinobacter adhaerens TaxID=1033846 RepID=UPI001C5D2EE9